MNASFNRILAVDLTTGTFGIETTSDDSMPQILGGKALGIRVLSEKITGKSDPFDSANPLVFATGPACGTPVWGSSRYGVFTLSPLTRFFAESYAGGRVPEAVCATGFDAIVITGKAKTLTVLEITPDGVDFHDANGLKGKDTFETEKQVKKRFFPGSSGGGKAGTVVVGPAAENGARFSIIKNDGWRCAGRCGTGTVMGNKNLKAVVFKGDRTKQVHDRARLTGLVKEMAQESRGHPVVHAYKTLGTSQMVKLMNAKGSFPTRYWSRGSAEHWNDISADALHSRCDVTPHACAKCYLACGRKTRVARGRHKGLVLEGPEYETLFAFGGLCMIDSIEEIAYLNHLCDSLGLDTITTGNLCAFAMKAAEHGKPGFEIQFGDADATADLIRMIAQRKGIGDLLSRGIIETAKELGMQDSAVHIKGLEPAGYDPRVLKGMGLGYALSGRGACHLRSTFYKAELSGMIQPEKTQNKAGMFIDFEDRLTLFDSMVLCKFYRDLYPWERLGRLIFALTGIDGSKDNLETIASDICRQVRQFNLKQGMGPEHEGLPRAFHTPLDDSGKMITPQEMQQMKTDYFNLRGWAINF